MANSAVLYLAVVLAGGALIAWLANIFTVPISPLARQLYFMLVISLTVYVVVVFFRPA